MSDLSDLSSEELDELDIEALLARVERKPLTFSRKQCLKQAPEFSQRLTGVDTVNEGQDTFLECTVLAFPRPDLTWYKDSDLILPDHPRMTVEEGVDGKYYLRIKNTSKGDEAGYKCKAENCEGTTASTFFLFVNAKVKKSTKSKNKRRRVSYPPMFATIVEKVEEEERADKEARYAPPSPLSELYVGITLKSRHTWPKFLGEWAFAEDAIRSCSDETESQPSSSDGGGDERINVKVKVSTKPVKSILKQRKRPENSDKQKTNKSDEPGKNGKATVPLLKSTSKRTESRKTTTTTTTTTTSTKTTKTTTPTTKTNGQTPTPPKTTEPQKALTSSQTAINQPVTKSETKSLSSKLEDSCSIKATEKKTSVNGAAVTNSSSSTTKSTTRSLTSHRVEETKQSTKTTSDTNTTASGPGTKPSSQEQKSTTNGPAAAKSVQHDQSDKKPLSKTQSLQEKLIQKTVETKKSSAKKINTGSLGISKLTEKLTGSPTSPSIKENGPNLKTSASQQINKTSVSSSKSTTTKSETVSSANVPQTQTTPKSVANSKKPAPATTAPAVTTVTNTKTVAQTAATTVVSKQVSAASPVVSPVNGSKPIQHATQPQTPIPTPQQPGSQTSQNGKQPIQVQKPASLLVSQQPSKQTENKAPGKTIQPSTTTTNTAPQLSPAVAKSPIVESPISPQRGSQHNMAKPGYPAPESTEPKFKSSTVIKTTQPSQAPASPVTLSPAAGASGGTTVVSNASTNLAPGTPRPLRVRRQESTGVTVVNTLVIDPRNAERPQQTGRARSRGASPVTVHRVEKVIRSRETSPSQPRTRVRQERGKSPIMQLLPTSQLPKSPASPQPSVPSPVRYLPIISVKSRPSEKVIVHQPLSSTVFDLRKSSTAPDSVTVVQKSVIVQPVEFQKPYGAANDPQKGLKQSFCTQEIQSQKNEVGKEDPKTGIKRSISTENLQIVAKNTDVLIGEKSGPVGAKAAVVDTNITTTKLITQQPAVPSHKVQPGLTPIQATQKEILTKETTKKTIFEVGKNNLPKGAIVVPTQGPVVLPIDSAPPKRSSLVGSLTSKYNTSSSASPRAASPSYLDTSQSQPRSRSPSPGRLTNRDKWENPQPQQPQPQSHPVKQISSDRSSMNLKFKPVDPALSPRIILSPVDNSLGDVDLSAGHNWNNRREPPAFDISGGNNWNRREPPAPPKRGSSVERMLSHSGSVSPQEFSPSRKTSLQFTPYFSNTELRAPVDIRQYLSQGAGQNIDRSRRCQSVERLPTLWYPSKGVTQHPPQPQTAQPAPQSYWHHPPGLNRSVSVDVIPGVVDPSGFRTFHEIPVQHVMSPDSTTLPRRRKRRNSVENIAKMFDAGQPVAQDDQPSGDASVANQYPDMGQQLLSQIQAFGDQSYQFDEGSATLPRTRDGRGGPRLKRRNSVEHMAKIFDQGMPVVEKDDDAIPIYGGSQQCVSQQQAPVNIVRPYNNSSYYDNMNRPPEYLQPQHPVNSRLSASTPHLAFGSPASPPPRTISPHQNIPQKQTAPASFQLKNKPSPTNVQSSGRSRAAACSLNLKHVPPGGRQLQQPVHQQQQQQHLQQKPVLRRSVSDRNTPSPQKVPHTGVQSARVEEEDRSYKRLSVGDAARLFDQKSTPDTSPVAKKSGGFAGKAQKFLAKFK